MISFEELYIRFLGFNPSDKDPVITCYSPFRDRIDSWRVPLITSVIGKKQRIFSVSSDHKEFLASEIPAYGKNVFTDDEWCRIIDDLLF